MQGAPFHFTFSNSDHDSSSGAQNFCHRFPLPFLSLPFSSFHVATTAILLWPSDTASLAAVCFASSTFDGHALGWNTTVKE
ncbi:hypothetical protein L1887_34448 [Cichorium endivia]|nr:hypothetical protein L1887_34448 [Cichorium endivia]